MSLMRWDPFSELNALRQYMNRFLETPWQRGGRGGWGIEGYGPRVDIYQTEDEVVASAELPGIESKEDIELSVTEDTLIIRGEFKRAQGLKDDNFYHSERYYGTFSRTVPLPAEVRPDQARATYRNGILEVRIPKSDQGKKKPVRIDIH
jgi:HSP20 family protein